MGAEWVLSSRRWDNFEKIKDGSPSEVPHGYV